MKNTYCFILIFINSLFIYSQEIVKNEIDEFEKIRIIETNWIPIYKGFIPGKTYLFRFSSYDSVRTLDIKISTSNNLIFGVNSGEGIVVLKCDDTTFIKFNNLNYKMTEPRGGTEGIWGGNTYGVWIKLTLNNFSQLGKISRINKIRIYTTEGYFEEDISKVKSDELIELYKKFEKTFNNEKK